MCIRDSTKAEEVAANLHSTANGSMEAARKGNEEVMENLKSMVKAFDEPFQEIKWDLKTLSNDRFQIAIALKRKLQQKSLLAPTLRLSPVKLSPPPPPVTTTPTHSRLKKREETLIIKTKNSEDILKQITEKVNPEKENIRIRYV